MKDKDYVEITINWKDLTLEKQIEIMTKLPDIDFKQPFMRIRLPKKYTKNFNDINNLDIP